MNNIFVSLPIEETLTGLFWSLTYLLICISGFLSFKIKKPSMPYVAGVLNYAWEINALVVAHGLWVYSLWFGLDFFIVIFGIYFLDSVKKRGIYIVSIIIGTIFLKIIFSVEHGMLISVFLIDLIMAISYLVRFKSLSPFLKREIAITRFLGDLFAGFAGIRYSPYYIVISVTACIINGIYVWKCFTEKDCLKRKML